MKLLAAHNSPSILKMQKWVVICWASLALVAAYECPDGGRCADGQTCCSSPVNGYECCPFDQAECCGDHVHCCPAGTICDTSTSSCVNANGSIPWMERTPANQPRLSKSFRMIKTYAGEEDYNNICPDKSRCPPEFSCLMALTGYGCCPLAQGIPCSDRKHCCPEGHECSADSRSCVKKEVVTTVLCGDGVSECPDGTTCCENAEGKWGCCPMQKAVCCEDKIHCCPEGSTCDVEHSKCISSTTKKETPMWAKLPARIRADWENQKECEQVTAKTVENDGPEKVPKVTTENPVPFSDKEVSMSSFSAAIAGNVPCDDTKACPDNTTCCKTQEGDWACCPLPEAVCCEDHIHCCPHGKKCNLAASTCDDDTCSVPWFLKLPAIPRKSVRSGDVICDSTHKCPDNTTCCKNNQGGWSCCPLPQAVCCDDNEHCCPSGYTCDSASLTCVSSSGTTPMQQKTPALTTESTTEDTLTTSTDTQSSEASTEQTEDKTEETEEPEENKEVDGRIKCDDHTSCPRSSTCCFMKSSQKWGCCPLPQAVCCSDGNHCCPTDYRCNEIDTSCVKGEVVIPWYTKLPADTNVQAVPSSVQCDDQSQCPEHTTCCQLATGQWGCCPLEHAVCCPDKEHCCPQGYTCNMAANSCQKPISLLLDTIPLTPVFLPLNEPEHKDVKCDEQTSCPDGQTCCKISATEWGCCPFPNAVCCSDMLHCCPAGYTCDGSGQCSQKPAHWYSWNVFLNNKKRALIV